MQLPLIVLAIAVEAYVVLLIAAIALALYSRKQKKILRRQQEKLLEFIHELKKPSATEAAPPAKTYRQYINEQIDTTQERFSLLAPTGDIGTHLDVQAPAKQQVIALRYGFLRAEELGTIETIGSDDYWSIFLQTLEPLLPAHKGDSEELDTYKKRVENLEKFKKLFFDLEERWNKAQNQAEDHFNELSTYADSVADQEHYTQLLNNYRDLYEGVGEHIHKTSLTVLGQPQEHKTINIIRQDPRAAEEIMKLRNVAADQHRVISNLQKQLDSASSTEEKIALIGSLEQQLQRQIRFVQESDTCVQLLEEELDKAHQQLQQQEQTLQDGLLLGEENTRIKETLNSFSMESKDLMASLEKIEDECQQLKKSQHSSANNTDADIAATTTALEQTKADLTTLQKQYAELEEKYLDLKLK